MQRVLECSVCFIIFDTKIRVPKTLSCGHSYCAPCLGNVLKGSAINCPKCRTNCHVPHSQVDKLPTNFSTLDTLDTVCEVCHNQVWAKRCSHCKLNLCQSCIQKHPDLPMSNVTEDPICLDKQLTKFHEKISCRNNVIDQLTPVPDRSPSSSQLPAAPDYMAARYSQMIGRNGSGPGQFYHLCGITASPVSGNVIVADSGNHRIQILTQSLQPVSVFGDKGNKDGQFDWPCDVAVSKDDKIFVSDLHNHRIQVTDNTGRFMYKFGTKGSGNGQLCGPRGLDMDQDDLLYICDSNNYRIQVTRLTGEVVISIRREGSGPGQFTSYPRYITVSRKGKLVVSDFHGNLYMMTTWDKHMDTIKANQPPHNIWARGLAVDRHDNIIIAHSGVYGARRGSCMVVLSETGDIITTIGIKGEAPGEIMQPTGITVTPSGDILVCDWVTNRVQLFTVPRS